ncbi:pharynx and intestine in excess protein 1 [Plakobranchus ocellatus]|uniref:Pharynx and intestine in excess protein 1 n=1 Tax=Plakobranchus ocellatus TaxID=259542 RepID=A0AAV3ZZA3_9GAST|nr:pharynx and intestine in excess protein 1 [Plakobranchus ocellatus]
MLNLKHRGSLPLLVSPQTPTVKMASLVADYSDSDSDDESKNVEIDIKIEPGLEIKDEPASPIRNFFEASGSDSDDEDQRKFTRFDPTLIKTEVKPEKLPNPLLGDQGSKRLPGMNEAASSKIGTCVFANPFAEAEQAKFHILEKHVKLTTAAPKKPAHQPVCWKFKKGKCHMGKNCRFFHDTESQIVTPQGDPHTAEANGVLPLSSSHPGDEQRPVYHPAAFIDGRRRPMQPDPEDEDHYMSGMRKKKRYGVTDNLLPPQKAFESLQRQRAKERPWTMSQLHK